MEIDEVGCRRRGNAISMEGIFKKGPITEIVPHIIHLRLGKCWR